MKIDIINRLNGKVIFTQDIENNSFRLTVEAAVSQGAHLHDANLQYANLHDANLQGANLQGANLQGAHLHDANLQDANLQDANLQYANLQDPNLQGANLQGANLQYANLHDANLRGANLQYANLQGANLQGANLQGANLQDANLQGAHPDAVTAARLMACPESGAFDAWKQFSGKLVKLRIPAEARRSSSTGRKCRAEFADVLEVVGGGEAVSSHDGKTIYKAGERVHCGAWCEDRWQECAGGIHFFITRAEAEAYS